MLHLLANHQLVFVSHEKLSDKNFPTKTLLGGGGEVEQLTDGSYLVQFHPLRVQSDSKLLDYCTSRTRCCRKPCLALSCWDSCAEGCLSEHPVTWESWMTHQKYWDWPKQWWTIHVTVKMWKRSWVVIRVLSFHKLQSLSRSSACL